MFAPPRGLSQLAAPFIAFWCLGIHHIPSIACLYYSILLPAPHFPWRPAAVLFLYKSLISFSPNAVLLHCVSCYQGVIAFLLDHSL